MTKASEILNETEEPIATVETLATSCKMFTICHECGHVDKKFCTSVNHPCQTCGVTVHNRRILFASEGPLLNAIFECYKSNHSREMCVLLFCSLFEQHLLNLLKSRCLRLNIQKPVMGLLLEGYWKVHERLNLFEQLTGVKAHKPLTGQSVASVFITYNSLSKKRNQIAHGLPGATYAVAKSDIEAAVNAAADSFSCFASLHHSLCAIDSPPLPKFFK